MRPGNFKPLPPGPSCWSLFSRLWKLLVDVEHLFLGTQADNMTDKKAKGRQARGERAPKAKLTEAQVLELRAEAAAGVRVSVLARKYDLNRNNVAKIIARKSWSRL